MAKDGTNRGGRRVKAGDKPYSLKDKIADGKSARVLDASEFEIDNPFEVSDFSEMCPNCMVNIFQDQVTT